jgi:hypothetical protein
MALQELVQATPEELLEWAKEIHHWATLMDKKGNDELAKKSYVIASLLKSEYSALVHPAANDVRTTVFVRKSVAP